jgi:CRP-like cAMP-binding protein
MSHIEVLKRAPVLQGLSLSQLDSMLATNPIISYQCNQVIFEEGSAGREMYIVLEGEVAVQVDPAKLGTVEKGSTQMRIIRTFGPGESFGEVAVIDQNQREATISATQDNTRLLVISPQIFDNVLQAQMIMANITRDLSDKLRGSNTRLIQSMLSSYFLTALVEQLATQAVDCNPIIPLQKLVVIRSPENFILSGPGRLLAAIPEKETIEISLFTEPEILQRLLGPGEPSGAVGFNALFSIIRSGQISERIAERSCRYELQPAGDRRTGKLMVWKTINDHTKPYTIEWQIKGARYNLDSCTSSAAMFLYIYDDEAASTRSRAAQIISNIAMPVQRHIHSTLPKTQVETGKIRVIIVHHRSHETARTLHTIQELGYQIDTFIGIPYGDVNWDYITMLDHAANHNYMSLKLITHPTEPTQYQFDFKQSSFLDTQTEQEIAAIYQNPAINGDYLAAMQALAEYRLAHALRTCRERGERLIVYEDGGYIVAKIYESYRNPNHPLHSLIKNAVTDGLIIGVVEVTVAGERKNLQMIQENNGQALLPVLSNARSDIKAVFEAMGVGEAVIHASATSFGRLGLPTFQTRRVAVIGGNGAIGTRLVEQLTILHNSTTNVFAVDLSDHAFSLEIDQETLPYAATRLKYRPLPRYSVSDSCLPVILDVPYSDPFFQPKLRPMGQAIQAFLVDEQPYQELALTNSYPASEPELAELWRMISQETGYQPDQAVALPDNAGLQYRLSQGNNQKTVTLLARSTILTFKNVSRLLRNGVDTVIGSTGYPIFSAKNLDDFLIRPNPAGQTDALALISASSKDYEFRKAIDLLNILLKLHIHAPVAADIRLGWFAEFYKEGLSFVQGDDFAALEQLLGAPLTEEALQAFIWASPDLAKTIGLTETSPMYWHACLADYISQKIRQVVFIRKEIRPDIGTIYHVVVNGQAKQVVLLADGLVVNFFARHEKGVKTEYIDPIVTMQLLSLVKLSTTPIEPGLHKMDLYLRPQDLAIFWAAINDYCRPLSLK